MHGAMPPPFSHSEHRVRVVGRFRYRLQYVPVFDNLSIGIEAKDVHARGFLAAPVQVAHVDERQVAVYRNALNLARYFTNLLDVAGDGSCAVWKQRVVLDIRASNQACQQFRLALVEDSRVDGVDCGLDTISIHGFTFGL